MPIRRIAVLYNPRPTVINPGLPDDVFEEYDSHETISAIVAAIGCAGMNATPIEADRQFPERIANGGFDLVFNIAEGEGRRCREAIPASILEFLGIPFTGSDAVTLGITLDKALARRIVSPEVPVARAIKFRRGPLNDLHFPVIVKPNDEGSSKGIRQNAICYDAAAAENRSRELQALYSCSVLVEEFLPGTEVTVGIVGNEEAEVLGMMEIAPKCGGADRFVYSVDAKRDWRNRVDYHVPPRLAGHTTALLREYAVAAYELLGCRDIARIDFRIDAAGAPRFIECNALPGLDPENSDIVLMSKGALRYEELIRIILGHAAQRYGLALP